MIAVIMAGGKGTRISSIACDIPKPMIVIEGKPVLEHQITCLKSQGIEDIILVTGHLGHIIQNYFRDGADWNVHITYYQESAPLGTAGALYYLRDSLKEDFLLINGDLMFDVDFSRFIQFHKEKDALISILTHPNNHPCDSAIIVTDANAGVSNWIHKETQRGYYKNRVNAGLHILSPAVIGNFLPNTKIDLDRDVIEPTLSTRKVFSYNSPEYVKDMGTPERYFQVCKDYKLGKIEARNLTKKQKAIFLDRDGTINQNQDFISTPEQLVLIEGVVEAICKINQSGYLAIVITNQPVIARGDCTFEKLDEIHNRMETLLGEQGAYVDAIYFCPHHPDSGFEGERPEYKKECDCRKPKPGLLLRAAQDFNIDLLSSFMIGDSIRDKKAGESVGCSSILIKRHAHESGVCSTLLDFVDKFLI